MDFQQICRLQDKLVATGSYLYKYPCEGFRSAELAEASSQPIGALLGNAKQYWVQVAERMLCWRKTPTASVSSKRKVPMAEVDSVCQGVRIIARARPIVAGQFRLCFTVTLNNRCLIFRAPSVRVLQTWIEAINRAVFDFGRPPARILNDNLMRTLTTPAASDSKSETSMLTSHGVAITAARFTCVLSVTDKRPMFGLVHKLEEVTSLLKASASVNARDVSGRTALTMCAKRGDRPILRLLLQVWHNC